MSSYNFPSSFLNLQTFIFFYYLAIYICPEKIFLEESRRINQSSNRCFPNKIIHENTPLIILTCIS